MGGGYGYGGNPGNNDLGGDANRTFRPATPNRRGQYSDAVLSELESQNDAQVEGIMGKVRTLKSVSALVLTNPLLTCQPKSSFLGLGCARFSLILTMNPEPFTALYDTKKMGIG